MRRAIEEQELPRVSFFDGGTRRGPIATRWHVRAWPAIYVLDREGVIRFKGVRGLGLENAIESLLSGSTKD